MRKIIILIMLFMAGPLLADEPYLLVGHEDYLPFSYIDDEGQLAGLDVEIIQKAAELAGIKVTIKLFPWARAMHMVETGEADGIFGCGFTPERAQYLLYPETPVREVKFAFFVNQHFKG